MEVFIPTPTLIQMQLGFKPIASVSVPVSVKVKSVSVLGSVNKPYVISYKNTAECGYTSSPFPVWGYISNRHSILYPFRLNVLDSR